MNAKVEPGITYMRFSLREFVPPDKEQFNIEPDLQYGGSLSRGWLYVFLELTDENWDETGGSRVYFYAEAFVDPVEGESGDYRLVPIYTISEELENGKDIRIPIDERMESLPFNYRRVLGATNRMMTYHYYFSPIQLPWNRLPGFKQSSQWDTNDPFMLVFLREIESYEEFCSWRQGRVVPFFYIDEIGRRVVQRHSFESNSKDNLEGMIQLNPWQRDDNGVINFTLWDAAEFASICTTAVDVYREKLAILGGNDKEWVNEKHRVERQEYLVGRVIAEIVHNAEQRKTQAEQRLKDGDIDAESEIEACEDEIENYKDITHYSKCEDFVKKHLKKECAIQDQIDFWGACSQFNFDDGLQAMFADYQEFAEVFANATPEQIEQIIALNKFEDDFSVTTPEQRRHFVYDQAEDILASAIYRGNESHRGREMLEKLGDTFITDLEDKEVGDYSPLTTVYFSVGRKFTLASIQCLKALSYVFVERLPYHKDNGPGMELKVTAVKYLFNNRNMDMFQVGWESKRLYWRNGFTITNLWTYDPLDFLGCNTSLADDFNKPRYQALGAAMTTAVNLFNLMSAQQAIYQNDHWTDDAKQILSTTGAVADLLEATLSAFDDVVVNMDNCLGDFARSSLVKSRSYTLFVGKGVPFLGMVSGLIDAASAGFEARSSIRKNDWGSAAGYGTAAAGGIISAVASYLALKGITVAIAGGATAASGIGAPPGAIMGILGGVIMGAGYLIASFAGDTDFERWLRHCRWGEDYADGAGEDYWTVGDIEKWGNTNKSSEKNGLGGLERQLAALNNIRYRLRIRLKKQPLEFDDSIYKIINPLTKQEENPTRLRITIYPSIMYDHSVLQLELLACYAGDTQNLSPNRVDALEIEPRLSASSGVIVFSPNNNNNGSSQGLNYETKYSRTEIEKHPNGRITKVIFEHLVPPLYNTINIRCMLDVFGNQQVVYPINQDKEACKSSIDRLKIELNTFISTKEFTLYDKY